MGQGPKGRVRSLLAPDAAEQNRLSAFDDVVGSRFARTRNGIEQPRVGLLSIGEEAPTGTPLVKETHALLDGSEALRAAGGILVGNVEGRDIMTPLEGSM